MEFTKKELAIIKRTMGRGWSRKKAEAAIVSIRKHVLYCELRQEETN